MSVMAAQTTNLFLLQDLEDSSLTRGLAEQDLNALRTVADWIKTFVAQPNEELGRAGPVCPFVPGACERKTLWLAAERTTSRSLPDVIELIQDYQQLLLQAQPVGGDDASYKAIFIVFTDLVADRAREFFADVLPQDSRNSPTGTMESRSESSTRETPGPRFATRAFDPSERRYRRC